MSEPRVAWDEYRDVLGDHPSPQQLRVLTQLQMLRADLTFRTAWEPQRLLHALAAQRQAQQRRARAAGGIILLGLCLVLWMGGANSFPQLGGLLHPPAPESPYAYALRRWSEQGRSLADQYVVGKPPTPTRLVAVGYATFGPLREKLGYRPWVTVGPLERPVVVVILAGGPIFTDAAREPDGTLTYPYLIAIYDHTQREVPQEPAYFGELSKGLLEEIRTMLHPEPPKVEYPVPPP